MAGPSHPWGPLPCLSPCPWSTPAARGASRPCTGSWAPIPWGMVEGLDGTHQVGPCHPRLPSFRVENHSAHPRKSLQPDLPSGSYMNFSFTLNFISISTVDPSPWPPASSISFSLLSPWVLSAGGEDLARRSISINLSSVWSGDSLRLALEDSLRRFMAKKMLARIQLLGLIT